MATAFSDPRVTLMYDDAARYLLNEGSQQNYDVIICDSSDPVGPAETLFRFDFFASMHNALAPEGIMCTQGECMWLHLDLIKNVLYNNILYKLLYTVQKIEEDYLQYSTSIHPILFIVLYFLLFSKYITCSILYRLSTFS